MRKSYVLMLVKIFFRFWKKHIDKRRKMVYNGANTKKRRII